MKAPYILYPCGDSALTIELGHTIDRVTNQQIIAMAHWLRQHPFTGFRDAVIAYSTLTVHFDPTLMKWKETPTSSSLDWVSSQLMEAYAQSQFVQALSHQHHRVPVCYDPEWGVDLQLLSIDKDTTIEEIIQWHCTPVYRVYMIGFLPGFPYMGEVVDELVTARKAKPVPVTAGSVGIAGKQTGIYPFASPGGWHIVGRTPLKLFDPLAEVPVPFKPGDEVSFYPISRNEFETIFNNYVNPGS